MSKDLLTIYWVTDLHILDTTNRSRPIRGLRHGILNIPEGGDRLAAFVTRVNLDRPDVVLCTGDIIDSHDYWLQKHREAQTTDGETFFEPRSSKIQTAYEPRRHLETFMKNGKRFTPTWRNF